MNASRLFIHVPNLITLARLLMAPLVVDMIVERRFLAAFSIFAVAGISDGIDGYVAKRFDLRSELGAYLDPLADKALLASIYITLAAIGVLAPALPILVVSRDLMILFAVMVSWLLRRPVEIRPVPVSKFNTVAQIGFAGLMLGARAFGQEPLFLEYAAAWIVAASTLASGAVYIAQWLDHMSRQDAP
jgi:cardiolipin synthase